MDTEKVPLRREDFVLSAKDLVELHQNKMVIPPRGPKESHPDGSRRQEEMAERRREQRQNLIKTPRIAKIGSLSMGVWEPDKELVVVKSHKGKFWHTMGYMLQGQKYLYPEEGLFLLEVGSMELHYGGVPMSIQRAYSLLIPTYLSKEHYRVYCHLMRLGYITTRHIESDITDYEYRLRMHQYRHTQKLAYHKVQGWFQQIGDEPMNSIWPDSDLNLNSLSTDSLKTSRRRDGRMSATNSNANTHNSGGSVVQSGCDSSEVGSAGEMSRVIKARQKVHRASAKYGKMCSEDKGQTGLKQKSSSQAGTYKSDSLTGGQLMKFIRDVSAEISDDSGEASKGEKAAAENSEQGGKITEFVEPKMADIGEKIAKAIKEESDESSEYSDGPVYPEEKEASKESAFDETSISLLDFHRKRLGGSSEEGSNRNKRLKMSDIESNSSLERKKPPSYSSGGDQCLATTRTERKSKTVQDDSGKDTHSDIDPDGAWIHQRVGKGKKHGKQGGKLGMKPPKDKSNESPSSDLGLSDAASSMSVDLEEFLDMVVPMLHGAPKGAVGDNSQELQAYLEYPHWNFDKITLPDIASNMKSSLLPFPAKELVPASIAESRCIEDFSTVEGKQLELTKLCNNNKMLLAKSKKIINVLELIGDCKMPDKNQASKNPSKEASVEPDNWKEYKEKKQQEDKNMTELLNSPVGHLWQGDVKPLVKPSDAKSTGHVLNKLQVIDGANLTCEHSGHRFSPPLIDSKISFDVFMPNKKYKKTNPGQPNFCVVVCSEEDPVPELAAQLDLLIKADPIPVIWGVVDNADINFYTLNDIELPVDITLG
ncbi:uncharacterized protein [Diadema antillarum]|uniref:uncharacterized protein n=1 Tax=Diadema antillarum TaxID=105358 RepID=UPI003A87DA6B